ncbi:MAG: radical SAM protein [Candidatus Omnitrophota bacterium]
MRVFSKKYLPLAKAAGKYVQSWITRRRTPLYAGLFITQRCNLRCVYCFPDSPRRQKEQEFSKEEIFRIADELYRLGTRYITILGGEPLMRADFGEIVDYIAEKGIILETGTNGYFTARNLDALKKLSLVCHSIDGCEAEHDKNRGKGSYKKVVESIELCVANKIPIQLRAVFTRNNAGSLEYLLDLAEKYGTSLGLAEQAVVRSEDAACAMTQDELRAFWKKVRRYKAEGRPVDKSFALLDKIIGYPTGPDLDKIFTRDETPPDGYERLKCNLSGGYMFLDSDGMLYPCARLFGKFGRSIYDDGGIKGAWEHLSQNDCFLCRQSVQDLKSYFFSHDLQALGVVVSNFLRK